MKLILFLSFFFLEISYSSPEDFWKNITKRGNRLFSHKAPGILEKGEKRESSKNSSILFLLRSGEGRSKIETIFEIESLEIFFRSSFDKDGNFIFIKSEKILNKNNSNKILIKNYLYLKYLKYLIEKKNQDKNVIENTYKMGYLNFIFNKDFSKINKFEKLVNLKIIKIEFKIFKILEKKDNDLFCYEKINLVDSKIEIKSDSLDSIISSDKLIKKDFEEYNFNNLNYSGEDFFNIPNDSCSDFFKDNGPLFKKLISIF